MIDSKEPILALRLLPNRLPRSLKVYIIATFLDLRTSRLACPTLNPPCELLDRVWRVKADFKVITDSDGYSTTAYGVLHSLNDRPALVSRDGYMCWYRNGELHRADDKPAEISVIGKYLGWYIDGYLHRVGDQPALIRPNGKYWYQRGLLHRDNNLPALINKCGLKKWCQRGVPVRSEHKDGRIDFYNKNGRFMYVCYKWTRDDSLFACFLFIAFLLIVYLIYVNHQIK